MTNKEIWNKLRQPVYEAIPDYKEKIWQTARRQAQAAEAVAADTPARSHRPLARLLPFAAAFCLVLAVAFGILPRFMEQSGVTPTVVSDDGTKTATQAPTAAIDKTLVTQEVFRAKLYLSAPASDASGLTWEYHLIENDPDKLGYIEGKINGKSIKIYVHSVDEIKSDGESFFEKYYAAEIQLRIYGPDKTDFKLSDTFFQIKESNGSVIEYNLDKIFCVPYGEAFPLDIKYVFCKQHGDKEYSYRFSVEAEEFDFESFRSIISDFISQNELGIATTE